MSTTIWRWTNSIESLKIGTNQWIEDIDEIQRKFHIHFQEIFQSSNPEIGTEIDDLFSMKISDLQNQFVFDIPSDEEITSTLKQTPSTKAPWPNGFTGLFYKYYWEIIKKDFIAAIKIFVISGRIPEEMNHMNIVLIPKTKNPNMVHQFRPISLSNVCYKVI